MSKLINLINEKFGRLTVIRRLSNHIQPNGSSKTNWECLCECGNIKSVLTTNLKSGNVKSCGCLNKESTNTIHGKRYSKAYGSWRAMKRRCYEHTNNVYHNYGGRGIKVCDRWLNSFQNFYEDMGDRPSKEYSLDRVNVNGDYTPENCRWATSTEQNCNRRDNIKVGENKISLSQYCRENNLIYKTILGRLRRGLSFEKAISY